MMATTDDGNAAPAFGRVHGLEVHISAGDPHFAERKRHLVGVGLVA